MTEKLDALEHLRSETWRRCATIFRLSPAEAEAVLCLLAIELVPNVCDRRRPTLAWLLELLRRSGHEIGLEVFAPAGHLVRTGLVELGGDGPFPERTVRLPDVWWPRLAGLPSPAPFPIVPAAPRRIDRIACSTSTRAMLDEALILARSAPAHDALICVAGKAGSGRETVATALLAELGFNALVVAAEQVNDAKMVPHLAREAAWTLAGLIISGAPSRSALSVVAAEVSTPIVVITDEISAIDGVTSPTRWRADVVIAPLETESREALWRTHLAGALLDGRIDLRALAARMPLGPGRIEYAAAAARRQAARRAITPSDLRAACRRRPDTAGHGLAQRIETNATFDELVVPTTTRRELELALIWARRGPSVFHPDGVGRRMRDLAGLVCLFHGPPGTGKTMGARVIASAIDADLLRVDLSQVVNKYIGETEKNLERVFEEAEATGAVLFFDEADALFGKRSEVKDAHDRYANIETAFLLQRLESHRGVCILASNLRQNLDDAFTRRIHVIAEFPLPERDDRRRIWDLQLPGDALASDVDFAMLADRAVLSGGDIRNAAATAALLASADETQVAMRHLVLGTWRELRKSGRLVSADVFGSWKQAILDSGRAGSPS